MNERRHLTDGIPREFLNAGKLTAFFCLSVILLLCVLKCAAVFQPFVIALAITLILDRPLKFLKHRLHIDRPVAAGICVVLVTILFFLILSLALIKVYVEAKEFIIQLPRMYTDSVTTIEALFDRLAVEYDEVFTPDLVNELKNILSQFKTAIVSLVNNVSKGVITTAVSVPQIFISFVITVLSSFFMLRDKEKLAERIRDQLPGNWMATLDRVTVDIKNSVFGYIGGILVLSLITFIELLIGFSVLGVSYGFIIALLCAVLDALPAIGTGWILTPWGIISIISGNYRLGVSLLILYAITFVVRQLSEPRIIGRRIGMYQLVLLFAMFLGMRMFGVLGLILGPLAAIVLRSMMRIYLNGRQIKAVLLEGTEKGGEDIAAADASEAAGPAPDSASRPAGKIKSSIAHKLSDKRVTRHK